MKISENEFAAAKNLLSKAQKIVIVSHRSPDGDTIGANLALRLALKYQWGKEVISACIDPVPENADFLPEAKEYKTDFDLAWADAIITVDAGADYMIAFGKTKPELFSGNPPIINIDHHPSNMGYGKINIVEDTAASTTQILFHFLKFCGFKMDRKITTCLLNGLYFDTGSFMHSNTTPQVLEVASQLLWKGADFKTIARRQFHTRTVSQLKIYGKILERAHVNDQKITVSAVTQKDFDETGAKSEDTTGAVDYLNSIPDGNFCCLLFEDRKGVIKGSFRTRVNNINLSELAAVFGGGGHVKASGFSLPGKLQKINSQIKIGRP